MEVGTLKELDVRPGDVASISLLHVLLTCDPKKGNLFWRPRRREFFNSERSAKSWNTRFANKSALTALDNKGYLHGHILGRKFRAHTIVWAMSTGSWPENYLDHINLIKSDNRISNLRPATGSQNQGNQPLRSDSTSGLKGVSWLKNERKWRASIKCGGKLKYLGDFGTEKMAHDAYCKAAAEAFGEYARFE